GCNRCQPRFKNYSRVAVLDCSSNDLGCISAAGIRQTQRRTSTAGERALEAREYHVSGNGEAGYRPERECAAGTQPPDVLWRTLFGNPEAARFPENSGATPH